jgi:hypothetical protein
MNWLVVRIDHYSVGMETVYYGPFKTKEAADKQLSAWRSKDGWGHYYLLPLQSRTSWNWEIKGR